MRRNAPRTTSLLAAMLLLLSIVFVVTPTSAQAAPTRNSAAEGGFLGSINAQRAAGGLRPLAMSGSMSAAATSWAFAMADGSFLAHASDIVSGTPGGWTKVGENVGRGQSVASLTQAFMASPGHRANIMDATFTHIGIGVYTHPTDGRIYTTHRFAALPGAAPAPVVVQPTAIPTPIPQPAAPQPTAIPTPIPQPVAPQPTAIPASPLVAAVDEPTAQTQAPVVGDADAEPNFGPPPSQLAFVDGYEETTAAIKLETKLAKSRRR